jgi:hypothetical protein
MSDSGESYVVELERRQRALLFEIETAFIDVCKGDGIGIREASQRDATYKYDHDDELALSIARAKDIEERWQDIPEQVLRDFEAPFMWTDRLGFHFMLPAYMRYALLAWHTEATVSDDGVEWIIAALSITIFRLEGPILTSHQIFCVKKFIEWIKDCDITWIDNIHVDRLDNWIESKSISHNS